MKLSTFKTALHLLGADSGRTWPAGMGRHGHRLKKTSRNIVPRSRDMFGHLEGKALFVLVPITHVHPCLTLSVI